MDSIATCATMSALARIGSLGRSLLAAGWLPRAHTLLELVRGVQTKSSAKKRFRINGAGLLTFRRSGKHHKMVKRSAANASRLGLSGTFTQTVSRRLRNAYFPGW